MSEAPMADPSNTGLLVSMIGGLGAAMVVGFGWLNLRINAASSPGSR